MFTEIVAPLLGSLLISLAFINLSTNINPNLHSILNEHFKQIQENSPIKYIRDCSLYRIKIIISIYLVICGFVLHIYEGIKRLFVIFPLIIFSIYLVQLAIIYGLTITNVLVYVFALVCMLIVVFHDCAHLDELEA